MPIVIFPRLLMQLVSLAVLAAGAYLLWSWFHGYEVADAAGVLHPRHGADWRLWTAVALLAWSFGLGRAIVLLFMPGGHSPMTKRTAGREVIAPDGSRLHVETSGLSTGPTVVLTHGWGLNSTAWGDARQKLGDRYRVVAWDLPGLGKSKGPTDGKYTLDRYAQALGAVVESTGADRVLLVGHSIGGMTTQTFFRAAPDAARRRVAGAVLVDTTHQDPARTMVLGGLWTALQKPLIEPMMHLGVLLSPLLWLSSWQGYLSGSNQIVMRLAGFGRFATRAQVDLTARLASEGSPAVQAKGNLAMLNWRVTDDLPGVEVPVLVLGGSKDIITLPRASREIATAAPQARFVEVEGAGHMGFMEAYDRYDAEIAAFAAAVLHTPAPVA